LLASAAAAGLSGAVLPALLRTRTAEGQASENLNQLLEPIRARLQVPALAAAYVRSSGVHAIGAVGVRHAGTSETVQSRNTFHLGSCTKSMTATLLAMLVEEGRLSWQTTIGEIFPSLRGHIHPGYQKATLVQLLSHQAGLPEDGTEDPTLWPQLVSLAGPMLQQRSSFVELVLANAPVTEPGTHMVYTNFGYVIAGAFAERVTGYPWETLMRDMLFEPLGMETAGFGASGGDEPWGHAEDADDTRCHPVAPGPEADNPPVIGPAATVHASLWDWGRYARLHLRGARGESGLLLKPETFRQLHRDWFDQGYALGWAVHASETARGRALTHAGANNLWYAEIWMAPARDAVFLAATNCGSLGGLRACNASLNAMIRRYL
jgi:CubicO group peptidase (beta-lactamase class C family)